MKKSFLGPNISTIGLPFLYFAISIVLFVFVARLGVTKISEQKRTIAEVTSTQRVLQQKESLLREVQGEISNFVDTTANALPEKNPALLMVTQLKNLALAQGLALSSFKLGLESQSEGISSADLSFDVDAAPPAILTFMQSLSTIAPVSTVEKAKVNNVGGVASANVSIKIYFAPYPKKLPALTEALTQLSSEERDLLTALLSLSQPAFTKLTPQVPGGRTNPFE